MLVHQQLSRPFLLFHFEKKPEFMCEFWVLHYRKVQSIPFHHPLWNKVFEIATKTLMEMCLLKLKVSM